MCESGRLVLVPDNIFILGCVEGFSYMIATVSLYDNLWILYFSSISQLISLL